jgi:O-antigen/teichoic acid export membrane protein
MTSPRRKDSIVRGANEVLRPDRAHPGDEDEVVYTPDPLDEQELTPPNAEPKPIKRLPGADEIKKNTMEALAMRALSTPLAFALTALQFRLLGPDGAGKYALATLTVLLFSRVLSDLGNAATREIGERTDAIGPVTALALRLAFVLAPLAAVIAVVLSQFPQLLGEKQNVNLQLAVLAAVALGPNVIRQTLSGVLVGLARVRLWGYLQIAPGILSLIGFLIFVVWLDMDVEGAILAWSLGHLITATGALIVTRHIWWPHITARVPRSAVVSLLRLAFAMGAINVILLLNYRVEIWILERVQGPAEVGIYRAATTVAEVLWIVTTALATAAWPSILHEREDRAVSMVIRSSLKGLLFAGIGAVALAVLTPTVLPLAFGEKYRDSVGALWWLLPGVLLYGPVAMLSVYISVRRRHPRLALIGPVLSIVVTIGLALLLIDRYGAEGAAAAASAGYIVSALVNWIMFARLAGLNWRGKARAGPDLGPQPEPQAAP